MIKFVGGPKQKPIVALDVDGTLGDCIVRTTSRQSRKAWVKAYGAIPDGMWVLHRCDNPLCINLGHLFLGTAKDNTEDMFRKARDGNRKRVKITKDIIDRWRAGESSAKLAEEVGCHRNAISWAARNRSL